MPEEVEKDESVITERVEDVVAELRNIAFCGGTHSVSAEAATKYADRIEAAALRLVEDLAWDYGTLADWYQHSIDNTVEPVWTDAHLKELSKDFYLIPKIEKAAQ